MKLPVALCALVVMSVAVLWGVSADNPGHVEMARLNADNWDRFAPQGKEVDAIYGDVVLRNQYLTAVIAEPLASRQGNLTVRDVAGALIDLTTRHQQSDQLSAFYPGGREFPFRAWQAAGKDGAAVDLNQRAYSGPAASVTVRSTAGEDRPVSEVTYRLAAGARHLEIVTRFVNTGTQPVKVPLEDDVRADSRNEDMVKSPNGTQAPFWIFDRHWGQAYGVDSPQAEVRANSNTRTSVLEYLAADGSDNVVLEPGESFELTRRIFPGRSLLDVKAVAAGLRGQPTFSVRLTLTDGRGRPVPQARVDVSHQGRSWGSATSDAEGRIETSLPAGRHQLAVTALGIDVSNGRLEIDVAEAGNPQPFDLQISGYRPGTVEAKVTDPSGSPVPCKVAFVAAGDATSPDFGPISAEFAVRNLRYAPHGEFQQALPAGQYKVIVSHGPEFDAVFQQLTVPPGGTVPLRATLKRSVDTSGWISSDFHSHSSPSGDNTASQLGRVLNLVCEHIEFAPCTEHNRISSYDAHIERLKAGHLISTVTGIELTGRPLPLNHQNAFPLAIRPHTQDGGGPLTDVDPERQIERLALWDDRSEKLIQQNHPDLGWLFYDRDGNGQPDNGYERSFSHMDVMEIHPVDAALDSGPEYETASGRRYPNRIFHWLQLLNQGFRIPGVVNTDAHYNFHGSGGLRNWIQSGTDDPGKIDAMDMVRAAEQGRLVMSNGPFLEVWASPSGASGAVTAGQDLSAPGGNVALRVKVQCPNWMEIDRVFVLVNGRRHAEHDYSKQDDPHRFRSGPVKFEETLDIALEADAHVVVVAGGEESELGPVMGTYWGQKRPAALTNPIFVDVDGGGFRPNKDTLGYPLPVKNGSR